MASKIETELTPEQVVELLDVLAKTPGGEVLRVIQAAAAKRGIEISLPSASTFRDAALKPFLERLKSAKHKSEMLAKAVTAGDENGLLASARTLLAEKINDVLTTDDVAMNEKQMLSLSKSLGTLSISNQGDRMTAARLREYEAKEAARKESALKLEARKNAIKKKGGFSDEAIALMEETLGLMA